MHEEKMFLQLSVFFGIIAIILAVPTPCNITTQVGCQVDQYCALSTSGQSTVCNFCSTCQVGQPCANISNCNCQMDNTKCTRYNGFCSPHPGMSSCEVCSSLTAPGGSSTRQSSCQCTASVQCPFFQADHSRGAVDVPQYCSQKLEKEAPAQASYGVCESCANCYDNFAVEGTCPDYCKPYYQCTAHTNCTTQGEWCDLSHKCEPCGVSCYMAVKKHESSIDGQCPMKCCNFVALLAQQDNEPLIYGPCNTTKGLPYTARWSFTGQVLNATLGSACSLTEISVPTDNGGTRPILKAQCEGLESLFSTCNTNKMTAYVTIFLDGKPVAQWNQSTNNIVRDLVCGIFGGIAVWLLCLILIPVGACFLFGVGCLCMVVLGRRRQQRLLVVPGVVVQQPPTLQPFIYEAPKNTYGAVNGLLV